jgi:hypothetical protein
MRWIILWLALFAVMHTANRISDQTESWALGLGAGMLVMAIFLLYDRKYPRER